ncbi:TonB-dependent receptor [Granulicella sp. S156]|uniref:TonB-dependent receptor n=1 Tax=Granulicella sp. S156 TaxID=1747224 RepID=UPI00131B5072|nr:TonB-dependent receptor [Granulicella sp. S156]
MNHKFPPRHPFQSLGSISRSGTLLLFILALLVASVTAHAQLAGKGAIAGTVFDSTGAAVPDATIVVTSDATGIATRTTSTSAGDFSVSTLDPGVYTITITAPSFEKLTQKNVQINALETVSFSPKLTVGAADQTVTVSALPPQLETTNATLGATMENEMYSALPIEMGAYGNPDQRRATDFAFLMPGVQGNNTTGNATTNTGIVNGSGSKGAVSDVYVDGVAFVRAGGNGDPRYVWTAISVDAIDQFQVQTSGYSAIYEGQGIQNYTVKQGGNKYHGSVYEFFRNTALDTWGFFGPATLNPATGKPEKPIENSNEYGINLSGPLVPFGGWKDKVFFYANYNGFRYASANPQFITLPTTAEQQGNFSGEPYPIYDPSTQAACTAAHAGVECRYQYAGNIVPSSEFSQVALNLQKFLPALTNQNPQNNYLAPNKTGLVNWSTTDRIDYVINPKDTLTMVAAIGRQASSNPVGQTTAGRNVGPIPYNYGQTYAPKTAVGIIEEAHTFTSHLVNQIKYGYARYNGPTFDADEVPAYSATTAGLSGLPAGAAQSAFPIVNFSSSCSTLTSDAPTCWGGTTPSVTLAENYTLVDNLQWVKGKHTFTFGGQSAWLLYNVINATGGSTPFTLATSTTETAEIVKNAAVANTGLAYASFLVGQIDKGSFTQYLQQEFGARFRAISPYVQDNWKVTSKLTLDLGLRYDFFPSVTEVHNAESFFSPNLANPVTGINGALQFTGTGSGTCNCSTPVNNYKKNFGPRIGLAFQSDPKTVWRASYGVMFTHGNAVGGSSTSLGTLGFSAAPSFASNGSLLSTMPLTGTNGAIPAFASACGLLSGPQYGTGYTTVLGYPNAAGCGASGSTASYTGTPSSIAYDDPYLGGRSPEFVNWTLGFQHQWTDAITSTITYVGSQGHFLPTDGGNPRGYYADQLNPSYLSLGSVLSDTGTKIATDCATYNLPCPAKFNTSQSLSTALKPFPFQTVTDAFGYVGNANYNALQVSVNMRPAHGLTFMANYTWSRSIDDGGTFRSGYAIPAAYLAGGGGKSWPVDRIERTVSTSNQPQHVVITGVWDLPVGRQVLAGRAWERAVFGGYKFSEVLQAFSGSPLAITGNSCGTNPSQGTCMPTYNPAFTGPARIHGKWGQGITAANPSAISYINSAAFITTPAYQFGNTARTAPYNLYGPGNYQLDIALVRSVPLHLTQTSRLNLRAEMYNVTNHTWFAVANTAAGNSSFGEVTTNTNYARRAVQLSGRIEF